MKRRGPRIMLIVLITAGLLTVFILTALPGTTRSGLGDYFGSLFEPVFSVFQKGLDGGRAYFGAVSQNKKLKEELADLEEEKARLELQLLEDRDKIKAYEELKEALGLVSAFENKTIQGARLANRDLSAYFDLFRIRAGRLQGIQVQADRTLPVVDKRMALVGRIHSSELNSSKVMPLIHPAFAVSARVEGSYRSSFRVRGDLELKDKGLCLADNIGEGTPIRLGDRLITSGEGGLYPEGILIGEVVALERDGHGRLLFCQVKPAADFEQLTHVFVLLEKDHES